MKIGQTPDLQAKVPAPAAPRTAAPASSASPSVTAQPAAVAAAPEPGVPVTVSSLARTLGQSALSGGATFDAAKVSAVRTAIQNGTYKVDAEAIADKLLSNAQQVLRKSQG